ncbi:nucleotidyl transferase AbiEii/AbiGii toxin family protein, partial [Imhoffiella purpurea]|uniref:Nucleotidyltransferase AbiEii toxin of type IV toxin-antitoxin system n=1 Tax=Imhoffiella purpurea TaxID=1249627 RepID=W9V8M3_9GAMM
MRRPHPSEDLDFILREPDSGFEWARYFEGLVEVMAEFGVRCELIDRGRMDRAVRQAMLKDDSIARQLDLSFYRGDSGRKLRVKLEIDTCPPSYSGFEYRYLDFPLDFEVCIQDLPSNFALKIHALLCRPYLKGRDWFDFAWYVARGVRPNLAHLSAAIDQFGPWRGAGVEVDEAWLETALIERIRAIDWTAAARDVEPFLGTSEQAGLKLWGERFFADKVAKLVLPA